MRCEVRILSLSLQFGAGVPSHVQPRISYAFRVFAAIYGHSVVANGPSASIQLFYGQDPPSDSATRVFLLPFLYRDKPPQTGNSHFTRHTYAGHQFLLSFGIDSRSGRPDWLGELFLWLSGGYEAGIRARDSIGRIPYSETIFNRQGISPVKAHASLLMAWLENILQHGDGNGALPIAPSPVAGCEHLVVCSHDVDFYFTNRTSALVRLFKNLGIAVLSRQPKSQFVETLRLIPRVLGGRQVGHYLPALIEANRQHNVQSTFFAVARRGHRRDPNYRIAQIAPFLRGVAKEDFSVGLHGSYRSILEDGSLSKEVSL